MSELNARLRALALSTPREALLEMSLPLQGLRAFLTGSEVDRTGPLRESGYLDDDGEITAAGEWLRSVTTGPDAVALSLRLQQAGGLAELQVWLDEDLALLIDTRSRAGVEAPEALIGYASYLDLPSVVARWLGLVPGAVPAHTGGKLDEQKILDFISAPPPACLGSLSATQPGRAGEDELPLVDFACDGERYYLILPPERAASNNPQSTRLQLAPVSSWNLLLLLTAAITEPPRAD